MQSYNAPSETPPSAPLSASVAAVKTRELTYAWEAPATEGSASITHYLFSITPDGGATETLSVDASTTTITFQNLVANTAYQASIKASNDNGASYGPELTFALTTPIVLPISAPKSGGTMILGPLKVMFAWLPPEEDGGSPITTYLFSMTPQGGETQTHVLDVSTPYYEADNLTDSLPIQATVKASNTNGASYGPEFTFDPVTPIIAPPAPPATASAAAVSPGTAQITWEAPAIPAQGSCYYVVMSQSSNSTDPSIGLATQDLTQTSCELSSLNPASEYTFTVCIVNGAGRSTTTQTNVIQFDV
jgi:titin